MRTERRRNPRGRHASGAFSPASTAPAHSWARSEGEDLFAGSYSRFGRLRTVGGHVPSAVKWQTRSRLTRLRTVGRLFTYFLEGKRKKSKRTYVVLSRVRTGPSEPSDRPQRVTRCGAIEPSSFLHRRPACWRRTASRVPARQCAPARSRWAQRHLSEMARARAPGPERRKRPHAVHAEDDQEDRGERGR